MYVCMYVYRLEDTPPQTAIRSVNPSEIFIRLLTLTHLPLQMTTSFENKKVLPRTDRESYLYASTKRTRRIHSEYIISAVRGGDCECVNIPFSIVSGWASLFIKNHSRCLEFKLLLSFGKTRHIIPPAYSLSTEDEYVHMIKKIVSILEALFLWRVSFCWVDIYVQHFQRHILIWHGGENFMLYHCFKSMSFKLSRDSITQSLITYPLWPYKIVPIFRWVYINFVR